MGLAQGLRVHGKGGLGAPRRASWTAGEAGIQTPCGEGVSSQCQSVPLVLSFLPSYCAGRSLPQFPLVLMSVQFWVRVLTR